MNKRLIVDTNVIVRHLTQDDKRHAKIAANLFEKCDRGDITLVWLPEVLAECIYVLESFYKHERAYIASNLGGLIESPGIEMVEVDIHLDALQRYGESKSHFVDCVLAASAAASDTPVATFDAGFKKFSDVRVEI